MCGMVESDSGMLCHIMQHHRKEKIVMMMKTVIFNLLEGLLIAKA
jgi:hypothetical protein